MMGADSPKKKMETPMDMGHSPKKFNKGLEKASAEGLLDNNPKFKAAVDNASDSPKEMKSPMDMAGMMTARKIYGGDGGLETLKNISAARNKSSMRMKSPMDDAHAAMEMESAMKLKSAMDMAKDGPMNMAKDGAMNLMEESPKKLTQDAAMKMAAAMKKFYNKD